LVSVIVSLRATEASGLVDQRWQLLALSLALDP
jgi:hypothetical protein